MALNFNNLNLRKLLLHNRSKWVSKEDIKKSLLPDLKDIVDEVNNKQDSGPAADTFFTVEILPTGNDTFIANALGTTNPVTYQWLNKSQAVTAGEALILIIGESTNQTVQAAPTTSATGMIACKVTDSVTSKVAMGYFAIGTVVA